MKRYAVAALAAFGFLLAACAAPSPAVATKPTASATTTRPRPYVTPPDGIPKPDPRLTPGATFTVTAAQVCVPNYSRSVRSVSNAEKNAVFGEYGITNHAPYSYEVDHLISLELGGSNDIHNLWPEPYRGSGGARSKDAIENALHAQVCSGRISLARARAEIVRWWTLPRGPRAPRATVGSVHPGAYCSPLGATGSTSSGTRMVCSDHSAVGTPYKGGTLHWRAA